MCILGSFHAPKSVWFQHCAPATGPSPGSAPLFLAFGQNFWLLGASSPLVAPISGYAYVKVSNNKQ